MCGIIGVFAPVGRLPEGIEAGMALLAHRGPDGEGLFRSDRCLLGHRRLSIVDIEHGHQPLRNEDDSLAAIHNGEIYNHREIIASLAGTHRPRTSSDGEALLHVFEEHRADGLRRLRGMFAAALWDGRQLVLIRDPLGIKPLYWAWQGGEVSFASEIGALLALAPAEAIKPFPPGHVWDGAGLPRRLWPTLGDDAPAPSVPDAAAKRVLELLRESVRQRLMADVDIGIFLSGGLDSSLIAALLVEQRPGAPSFAVGMSGSADIERAREVALLLGTTHHEMLMSEEDVIQAIDPVVGALESSDVDLVRSAIPCWFVSRLAARTVKVVLTGEGADELFAGYGYHAGYGADSLNRELRRSVRELHQVNLQRVDRMSMSHGLEARVPFLDVDVVDHALSLPVTLKRAGGADKLVLRQAAEQLLPSSVAWRAKQQFDQGSGVTEVLVRHFGTREAEAQRYRSAFMRHLPQGAEHLVARWDSGRMAEQS